MEFVFGGCGFFLIVATGLFDQVAIGQFPVGKPVDGIFCFAAISAIGKSLNDTLEIIKRLFFIQRIGRESM